MAQTFFARPPESLCFEWMNKDLAIREFGMSSDMVEMRVGCEDD
jgi:hypothetical protein